MLGTFAGLLPSDTGLSLPVVTGGALGAASHIGRPVPLLACGAITASILIPCFVTRRVVAALNEEPSP